MDSLRFIILDETSQSFINCTKACLFMKQNDFVEIDFTGKLPNGTVFDTTMESVAKTAGLNPKGTYKPVKLCIGKGHVLLGIDEALLEHNKGSFSITLTPEKAFGKKNVKMVRLIPLSEFKEHNVNPVPGMTVDFDGKPGVIMRRTGGRVMVNFNHPLAGKEVVYDVTINKKIENVGEQIQLMLEHAMKPLPVVPEVTINKDTAEVTLPFELPETMHEGLSKIVTDTVKIKSIVFKKKE